MGNQFKDYDSESAERTQIFQVALSLLNVTSMICNRATYLKQNFLFSIKP